jgi:hypothetical protein
MHLALRDDPARLLKYGVRALSAFLVVGRRLAAYLHRLQHQIPTAADAEELMQMWARLESHCQWGREVLGPVMGRDDLDKFSVVVLEVHPSRFPLFPARTDFSSSILSLTQFYISLCAYLSLLFI